MTLPVALFLSTKLDFLLIKLFLIMMIAIHATVSQWDMVAMLVYLIVHIVAESLIHLSAECDQGICGGVGSPS